MKNDDIPTTQNQLSDKSVLITQLRLTEYAGSEIATLEIVEYFAARAKHVYIVTSLFEEPIKSEFESIRNVSVHNIRDNLDSVLKDKVDIAWIQHQMIPDAILNNQTPMYFVFNHMSFNIGVEHVLFPNIEHSLADRILFNSQETLDIIRNRGMLYGVGDSKLEVFNNPAPATFSAQFSSDSLKKVLVVTNHMPEELIIAVKRLEAQGVNVVRFGIDGSEYRRVLPDDIKGADAVVTIGKTVQYSILAGTPVYCYDKFGGPGYLLNENYSKAKRYNFSGRGFTKKSAQVIEAELINDFSRAAEFMGEFDHSEKNELTLETRLERLIGNLLKTPCKEKEISQSGLNTYIETRNLIYEKYPLMYHLRVAQNDIKALQSRKNALEHDIEMVKSQYEIVALSRSYRLGRIMTYPMRKAKETKRKLAKCYVMAKNITRIKNTINNVYGIEVSSIFGRPDISLVVRSIEHPTSSTFIRMISPLKTLLEQNDQKLELVDGDRPKIASSSRIVIVQRTALIDLATAKNLVDKVRRNKAKLFVDTDDAFGSLDPNHPQYELQKDRIEALDYALSQADVVWVSTDKLREAYASYNTKVVKNTVDERVWSKLREERIVAPNKGAPLEIIYMGTKTHDGDFGLILPVLEQLHEEHPGGFRLHMIGVASQGEQYPWLVVHHPPDGLYPNFVEWFSEVGAFDIGISPLEDTEFNENKSDIKCLDYLAIGAKPVVSDVEAYKNPELDKHIVRVKNTRQAWLDVLEHELVNRTKNRQKAEDRVLKGYRYIKAYRTPEVAAGTIQQTIDELEQNV